MGLQHPKIKVFRKPNDDGGYVPGYHILQFETPDGKVYQRTFKIIDLIALAMLYRKESGKAGWTLALDMNEES